AISGSLKLSCLDPIPRNRRASMNTLLLTPIFGCLLATPPQPPRKIEFNRDIRPILSENCFTCHGPAKSARKAGLRFDTEEGAKADLGDYFAIVPGKPGESKLIERTTATDKSKVMPPPSTNKKLSPQQIELLRQWIAEGAVWQQHWAFIAPTRPR